MPDAHMPDARELSKPLVDALVQLTYAIVDHVDEPGFATKHQIGNCLEEMVDQILAEVDRRLAESKDA